MARTARRPALGLAHLLLRASELLLHIAGDLPRRHPLAAHLCHRGSGLARWGRRSPAQTRPRVRPGSRPAPRTDRRADWRGRSVRPEPARERRGDPGRDGGGRGGAGPGAAVSAPRPPPPGRTCLLKGHSGADTARRVGAEGWVGAGGAPRRPGDPAPGRGLTGVSSPEVTARSPGKEARWRRALPNTGGQVRRAARAREREPGLGRGRSPPPSRASPRAPRSTLGPHLGSLGASGTSSHLRPRHLVPCPPGARSSSLLTVTFTTTI